MPLSRTPSEKKSHNPLKFFRTSSHHQSPTEDKKKHHFGLRSRSNTMKLDDKSTAVTNGANNVPNNPSNHGLSDIKKSHMTNPFIKGKTFDVLGTGNDIAAPRGPGTTHNGALHHAPGAISRIPSMTSGTNHNKPIYNPYGLNSRTASSYSLTASSDDDKKHILSTPIRDPNELLPLDMKQEFHTLSDGFIFPEKNRKKLGDGASATVFLVQHKKTMKSYALKKFQLLDHETDEEFYNRAIKEFIIAKKLSHNKHIVTTFYCLKIQTTTNISRGWGFILDYCPGGDLFNMITRPGWKSHPIVEKYCIFKQLVLAVQFIHSKGVVHRDLKPENILIDANGCVKITDFGIADFTHEDPDDLESPLKKFTQFVGSPPYVSPELMKIQKNHCGEYDPYKLDLWSVGVILLVMIYQAAPFKSASPADHTYREWVSSYESYISANPSFRCGDVNHGPGIEYKYAKDFLDPGGARVAWRLCDPNPDCRYTLKDVLKDPWFMHLECCAGDDEDEDDPIFQRLSSFDSVSSAAPSPSMKPSKSMLDFTRSDVINQTQPIGESAIPNSSETILSLSSQTVLPPVAEDHNESESPQSAPKMSMCDSINPIPKPEPENRIPLPQSSASSTRTSSSEPLRINTDLKSPPMTKPYRTLNQRAPSSSNIDPQSQAQSHPPPSPLTHQKNPPSASLSKNERASSFSSLLSSRSNRSIRSNGSQSELPSGAVTPSGKKKIRHHHLDVSTVSNHGPKR